MTSTLSELQSGDIDTRLVSGLQRGVFFFVKNEEEAHFRDESREEMRGQGGKHSVYYTGTHEWLGTGLS